jgi:hypothetical protein
MSGSVCIPSLARRDCQRKHWSEHKTECKEIETIKSVPKPASEPAKLTPKSSSSPRLPAGASSFFADEAVPLSLETSKTYGRHLVMKYDVMPSDVILAAEAYAGMFGDGFRCDRTLACLYLLVIHSGCSAKHGKFALSSLHWTRTQ